MLPSAAVGIDGNGEKHPLGVIEGATDLPWCRRCSTTWSGVVWRRRSAACSSSTGPRRVSRDPATPSAAIRRAVQRCQGPQGPQHHRAPCRTLACQRPQSAAPSVVRLDDADKAERLIKNLARRLEHDAPGVAASILEGDSTRSSTVTRPRHRRACRSNCADASRSPAPTERLIENMNGTIRQPAATSNAGGTAKMALRWTGAAMLEAAKGFRRLKAHKQLPISCLGGPRGRTRQVTRINVMP